MKPSKETGDALYQLLQDFLPSTLAWMVSCWFHKPLRIPLRGISPSNNPFDRMPDDSLADKKLLMDKLFALECMKLHAKVYFVVLHV